MAAFLRDATHWLLDFVACDVVELWFQREEECLRCRAERRTKPALTVEIKTDGGRAAEALLVFAEGHLLRQICRLMLERQDRSAWPCFTKRGTFWTGNLRRTWDEIRPSEFDWTAGSGEPELAYSSIAILPLHVAGTTAGLVHLKSRRADCFGAEQVTCFEGLAEILAVALVNQLAHAALRERIKELTCLYSLAQLSERPGVTLEEILQGIAELLPAAWQYPEVAAARIVLDGRSYSTTNFRQSAQRQSADLMVNAEPRGRVEVVYVEQRPGLAEGPFLKEERSLIDVVARQVALIVERRQVAEEKLKLQDQLRHADRLATIGQLAAGVAHELNEPLGNILAFAQLVQKQPALPRQAEEDLAKIVRASLQAREIIRKLMLFARQMPPQRTRVDLNRVIEEGLNFLGSRCEERHVVVKRRLSARLPRITADPSQLHQVLVNLVVNAIQAMPEGGTLKITTRPTADRVVWVVEDNGSGMDQDVLNKIFVPFYTTKDVGEGTGLGLPVVHGIVTAHRGTITVRSAPGQGARFEIRLPVMNMPADKEGPSHEIPR